MQYDEFLLIGKGFVTTGPMPSVTQRVTCVPAQRAGEAPWRVDGFRGSFRAEPQDKDLPLTFLFILFFTALSFK